MEKTKKQQIVEILHGKKTDYKDCEVLADDILAIFEAAEDDMKKEESNFV